MTDLVSGREASPIRTGNRFGRRAGRPTGCAGPSTRPIPSARHQIPVLGPSDAPFPSIRGSWPPRRWPPRRLCRPGGDAAITTAAHRPPRGPSLGDNLAGYGTTSPRLAGRGVLPRRLVDPRATPCRQRTTGHKPRKARAAVRFGAFVGAIARCCALTGSYSPASARHTRAIPPATRIGTFRPLNPSAVRVTVHGRVVGPPVPPCRPRVRRRPPSRDRLPR
jgi:hypothetical protein